MSRCFPYTPRGKSSSSEAAALIVSIKLQSENKKAISDRDIKKKSKSSDKKDKKRERKEKKEKKREEKSKPVVDCEKQKSLDKSFKAANCLEEPKGKSSLLHHESEVLERSSLTEEHGRPLDSQNVSCSSDSTSNSRKRKRHSSPPNSIQSRGNIVRIRLSSSFKRDEPTTSGSTWQPVSQPEQKREDSSTSYSMVRPCSNFPRTETSIKVRDVLPKAQVLPRSVSASTATVELVSRKGKELLSLQDKKPEFVTEWEHVSSNVKIETGEPSKKLSSHERKLQKKEALYNQLFQNLVPRMLESQLVVEQDDSDDWLFGRKDEEGPAKRSRVSDDLQGCVDNFSCSASAVLQPRAHFLSDAGIYALPFTIPF